MSANIKSLGWFEFPTGDETQPRPQKTLLPKKDGKAIAIIADSNSPTAFGKNNAYGTGTDTDQIRFFDVAVNHNSAVEVLTISPGGLKWPQEMISGDLFEDDSVGLAYQRGSGNVEYRRYSTAWAQVGATEVIYTPTVGSIRAIDFSISDGDVPAVVIVEENPANPKLTVKVFIRKTSSPAWVLAATINAMTTADPNAPMTSVSLQFVKGGSATARALVVGLTSAQTTGTDLGLRIYSGIVDEPSGAMTNVTLRQTYLSGDMKTSWGSFCRRSFLFRSGTNEITIAYMQAADGNKMLVARCTFDGTTWAEVIPPQVSQATMAGISKSNRFTASYSNNRVNFYYIAQIGSAPFTPINYIAAIDPANQSVRFSGWFSWDNRENSGQDRHFIQSGTGRNADTALRHGTLFFGVSASGLWNARVHDADTPPAPTAVTLGSGTNVTSGTPNVSMRASLNKAFPQSKHKAVWQVASDASFTTNVKTFIQDDAKFIKIENTVAPSYVYISDVWPAALALSSGSWFIRGALIDEYGQQGAWGSGTGASDLSHPPAAVNLQPSGGVSIVAGPVTFDWDFTDPSPGDTQSAFQVVVERSDDGTVIHDSGKQTSGISSYQTEITTAFAGTQLRWKIRPWDADGTPGNYTDYATFQVAAPPTVTINTPALGGNVNSATPNILFTPTVGDGRTIKKYQLVLTQNGILLADSGQISANIASGTQVSYRFNQAMLPNGTYDVQVEVVDSVGMSGVSAVRTFTVNTVAPPTSSGNGADVTQYNVEGAGYVSLTWSDANRDTVYFESWVIYRKDDLIDQALNVLAEGAWKEVGRVKGTSPIYEYRDHYAPSGYKVSYRVEQLVNRNGDFAISSSSNIIVVYPRSEGYWLIVPVNAAGQTVGYRLHIVTSDEYTDEWEEVEYNVVGRGRKVDQGDHLGVKGSLGAQLRDTGGTTARQKKLNLEMARSAGTAIYLRNPFGDVYYVSLGNLQISRLAGVGVAEFVDVTVPYSEVGNDQ